MSKQVEFICPNCEAEIVYDVQDQVAEVRCGNCGETTRLSLSENVRKGHSVDQCCVCEGHRFYVQKDFNPRLGLLIFLIGVIFSYHTYGITLFVASGIDFVLYKILPTVIICYNCRAIYRGFENGSKFKPYDPNVAIKYVKMKERQEAVHESSS